MKNEGTSAGSPTEKDREEASAEFREYAIDHVIRHEISKNMSVIERDVVCHHCGNRGDGTEHIWWCPTAIFSNLASGKEIVLPHVHQIHRVVWSMVQSVMRDYRHYYHDMIKSPWGSRGSKVQSRLCIYCGHELHDHSYDCPLSIVEKRVSDGLRKHNEKEVKLRKARQTKLKGMTKKGTQREKVENLLLTSRGVYRSVRFISEVMKLKEASVRRILNELKQEGWVVSHKTTGQRKIWKWRD